MRASIDIGSNSVLLLAGDILEGKFVEKLNEANITGLGKNLDKNGIFLKQSMEETYKVLKEYKSKIEKLNIDVSSVVVTATEASRVAKNADSFFKDIKRDLGFSTNIITSTGEAFYTGLGISKGCENLGGGNKIILDIGGASTELIKIKTNPFEILSSVSLPIGSVRATDWLKNDSFKLNLDKVFNDSHVGDYETEKIICVAGTMTSLGAMLKGLKDYKDFLIDGYEFNFSTLERFILKLNKMDPFQILKEFPIIGKRFETITGGGIVGIEIGRRLNVKNVIISTRGLRYGTLIEGVIDEQFISRKF
jgi:exopolyphosphatase / guanosine-5'-triphosphate,3'-diphosphate pyrophosphatase